MKSVFFAVLLTLPSTSLAGDWEWFSQTSPNLPNINGIVKQTGGQGSKLLFSRIIDVTDCTSLNSHGQAGIWEAKITVNHELCIADSNGFVGQFVYTRDVRAFFAGKATAEAECEYERPRYAAMINVPAPAEMKCPIGTNIHN